MEKKYPLKVYKASAGSGKTFTLAVEYIKLLIDNPTAYRSTLAVTFTNKATEEMKLRILSQLYGLAHGYADSADYMRKITEEMHCEEAVVKSHAARALSFIIHDYTAFRVETIDKFFQRVLKNLARELDLTANLHVELNDEQTAQLAVDSMIESLQEKDELLKWMMQFILDKIGDDKSWNVVRQLKSFSMNIFKDTYKKRYDDLQVINEPHFFDRFTAQLRKIREDSIQQMTSYGQRFLQLTQGYTAEDFYQTTKGIYNFFLKLSDGIFDGGPLNTNCQKCLEPSQKWYSGKTAYAHQIDALAKQELLPLLLEVESHRMECYHHAQSAKLALSHLSPLRLLSKIETIVREINTEGNRLLLSDTQGLLHGLIDESDTPFVFERIGAPLRNIMIDEFQDTGALQWQNFKILLDNCMAQGGKNLIVGDVKQSIYRWRAGDWRLLNSIDSTYGQEVEVLPLDTNYRSTRKVVEFNNLFFTTAREIEYQNLLRSVGDDAEQMRAAYADVEQKVPANKPDDGYVRVSFMGHDADSDTTMTWMEDIIRQLLDHGVEQRKIAILARTNIEIEQTASYFQSHDTGINIVSDEAFRLDASLAVTVIIAALRVIHDEQDLISCALLVKAWHIDILGHDIPGDDILLHDADSQPLTDLMSKMPEGFRCAADLAKLREKPLNDLTESIYHIFDLDHAPGQEAYICTFYDIIAQHLTEYTSDIARFLQVWDDKYHTTTIHGDEVDGVRIISIHKSKGLEYDNVIIPFCNWQLEKSDVIWCETQEQPYAQLPLVPINFSRKTMVNTTYEAEYKQEHLQNVVDNLNLLYVAFTRARTRLYVLAAEEKKDGKKKAAKENDEGAYRSKLIEETIKLMDGQLDGCTVEEKKGMNTFEYGTCFPPTAAAKAQKESETSNIFLLPEESEPFVMKSYPLIAHFRQSNESQIFTEPHEERDRYIRRGNLLHQFYAQLASIDDMEKALRQLSFTGVLGDEVTEEDLRQQLQQALSNSKVREWFDTKWTLHNECAILFRDPDTGQARTCRPDRVMSDGKSTIVVDFKFGKPKNAYHEQVRQYMRLLRTMGHQQVEGYLWYVDRNQIERVSDSK